MALVFTPAYHVQIVILNKEQSAVATALETI